ncbi:unnamed protein product [Fusarium fujikuroi]|uniref:Uncharacterized protein n=1 Tax=Fusarium fujikuroi TaxID=5127 RepID=A0A9Q9U578_FUSFU|nr:unnamed protein product [Fusarium fujikuroi]VZH95929.1 unnamed protein product [Fusarium fujikuroi]
MIWRCYYFRSVNPEKPSFQNALAGYMGYKEPAEVDRYSTLRNRLSELSEASGKRGMELFEQLYEMEEIKED